MNQDPYFSIAAQALTVLALGVLVSSCTQLYPPLTDVACEVEVSPTAAPEMRRYLSITSDYYTCDEKENCPSCPVTFTTEGNFSSGVSFDGSPIEDHWGRSVAWTIDFLQARFVPDFQLAWEWCIQRETLQCEQGRVSNDSRLCLVEADGLWLPDCPPEPVPAAISVGCDAGVFDGCTVATVEAPVGGAGRIEIWLTNDGSQEAAIRDIELLPFGNTPEGEFTLQVTGDEEVLGCGPSFPVEGPLLHILTSAPSERHQCAIGVDFRPEGVELRTAQLAFSAGGIRHTVDLEGVGIAGAVSAAPESVCLIGGGGVDCTNIVEVTLTNDGPGRVTLLDIFLEEADASFENFFFVPESPDLGAGIALEPNETLTLEVQSCRSLELPNDLTGTLTVLTDNPQLPRVSVPLEVSLTGECPPA